MQWHWYTQKTSYGNKSYSVQNSHLYVSSIRHQIPNPKVVKTLFILQDSPEVWNQRNLWLYPSSHILAWHASLPNASVNVPELQPGDVALSIIFVTYGQALLQSSPHQFANVIID